MAGNVKQINAPEFDSVVLASSQPVVVDFFTTWCGPCKMLAPILEELAGEYHGRVTFVKVDADQNMDLTESYGVGGFPTLILFQGGQPVDQIVGLRPKPHIAAKLDETLANAPAN